jgi:hypothetical protein
LEGKMSEQAIKFNDKSQIRSIYVDYLRDAYPNFEREPKSSNHSPKITTEDFAASVEELAAPFSSVVEAFYAD